MEFALPASRFYLPYDAAILQFVLHGVGYIGVRRGHAVLEAEVLDGIHLEGERVTRVLVRETRNGDEAIGVAEAGN